jgi:putative membrane protein insertion efficiency factor
MVSIKDRVKNPAIRDLSIKGFVKGLAKSLALSIIRFYRCFISPLFPPCCRYEPTCSAYAYEAVLKYGVCRGMFMAVRRILRCHPFHPGGYDPVK